jgi:hypothetical protein
MEVSLNGAVLFSHSDNAPARLSTGAPGIVAFTPGVRYDRLIVKSDNIPLLNQPPTAVVTVTNASGPFPLYVHFDASASFDPDGSISNFAWDFGDGGTVTGLGPQVNHSYHAAGSYRALLTVTDNHGGTGSYEVVVVVLPRSGPILYDDSFSRTTGLGNPWTVYRGTFTTDGNFAVGQSAENWAAVRPVQNLTSDYGVTALLTLPPGGQFAGIVVRGDAASGFINDLYAVQISTQGVVTLFRRNGGVWTLLASVRKPITAGQPYLLTLRVSGSDPVLLQVEFNNGLLMSVEDRAPSRIRNGDPGIQTYTPGVKYDRFLISGPVP